MGLTALVQQSAPRQGSLSAIGGARDLRIRYFPPDLLLCRADLK